MRTVVQETRSDPDVARALFEEYQAELGVDLEFQSFRDELATLPGKYAPPRGVLYVVFVDGAPAGCGALRPLDDIAEIKRVYVRPAFRRRGIARELSERLIADAARLGYRAVRLDTLRRLAGPLDLYRSLGFAEIPPYNENPEPDIVYLERTLP